MGLGTDYGIWTYSHQQMQAATDAAAVTGAAAYTSGGSAPVVAQVNAFTTSYGFTPGQHGVVVTVNRPPTKGSYAGNASAVEVIAQQPSNLLFAAFWLSDAPLISTRSVPWRTLPTAVCWHLIQRQRQLCRLKARRR
jgi:hypothetical protein